MARARFRVLLLLFASACSDPEPHTMTDAPPLDAAPDAAVPGHVVAYVAGYGPNIAWLDLDTATGALVPVGSIAAAQAQPSFLAMTGTHLYAVSESGNRVGAYRIDRATGALTFVDDAASGGTGPAHLSVDRAGKFVLVANYGSGAIAVLPIRSDGGVGAATQMLTAGANAHMILAAPGNQHVLVPCKGADYIAQYTFDPATGTLDPNSVPRVMTAAGAGPRHLAFAPDGAHAYLVNENDSTLVALAFDASTGRLSALQTLSTRATGATGANTGAEVAVHPSGKWVYASNRGDNDIAVFSIAPATGMVAATSHTPTGGMTPRAFAIDPTGKWLFAANQGSNTVIAFAIDPGTGGLTRTGAPLSATQPSFVGFVALPPT